MPRRLPAKLETLVNEAFEACNPDEDIHIFKLAALAQALSEAGIPSEVRTMTVTFDPEQWMNPEMVNAIRINACITNGQGAYGWDEIIEKARLRLGYVEVYVDQQHKSTTSWADLHNLNGAIFGQRMQEELDQMRAIVQRWSLNKETSPSPTAPKRRPGL